MFLCFVKLHNLKHSRVVFVFMFLIRGGGGATSLTLLVLKGPSGVGHFLILSILKITSI